MGAVAPSQVQSAYLPPPGLHCTIETCSVVYWSANKFLILLPHSTRILPWQPQSRSRMTGMEVRSRCIKQSQIQKNLGFWSKCRVLSKHWSGRGFFVSFFYTNELVTFVSNEGLSLVSCNINFRVPDFSLKGGMGMGPIVKAVGNHGVHTTEFRRTRIKAKPELGKTDLVCLPRECW